MTYYKIKKYLEASGLTSGKAAYTLNMIRELVHNKGGRVLPRKATCMCGRRSCNGGCYEY